MDKMLQWFKIFATLPRNYYRIVKWKLDCTEQSCKNTSPGDGSPSGPRSASPSARATRTQRPAYDPTGERRKPFLASICGTRAAFRILTFPSPVGVCVKLVEVELPDPSVHGGERELSKRALDVVQAEKSERGCQREA